VSYFSCSLLLFATSVCSHSLFLFFRLLVMSPFRYLPAFAPPQVTIETRGIRRSRHSEEARLHCCLLSCPLTNPDGFPVAHSICHFLRSFLSFFFCVPLLLPDLGSFPSLCYPLCPCHDVFLYCLHLRSPCSPCAKGPFVVASH